MKQINVIFKTNATWESDWLKEIFFSIPDFEFVYRDRSFVGENSIIVTDNPQLCKFRPYLNKAIDFILINLKDEHLPTKQDLKVYKEKSCKFIFRNYLNPDYSQENLFAFPLGYKSGFWDGFDDGRKLLSQSNNNRKYNWSFAGTAKKSGRRKTISKLEELTPYHLHDISFWDAPESLSTTDYRDLMLDSHFIPSFRGNFNLECYRTYEALEAGAIPIIQKFSHLQDYDLYKFWYGEDHPLISVGDIGFEWPKAECSHEAYELIKYYTSNQKQLEELRHKNISWWNGYKKHLQEKIQETYEAFVK